MNTEYFFQSTYSYLTSWFGQGSPMPPECQSSCPTLLCFSLQLSPAIHRVKGFLKKTGITLKTARYARFFMRMRQPFMKPYKARVEEFMVARNIQWMQCLGIDKIGRHNLMYMYIVGHMADGKKTLLYKIWCPKDTEINNIWKGWLSATFD